jgi:multidrug efflux pump subunit AcrB
VRWRKTACLLLALAFGLPVFLLPDKIDMTSDTVYSHTDSLFVETYNRAMSNTTYKEKVKPALEKALGGSLRLFVQKVYEGSYFRNREETVLTVTANLPNGSTLEQMNHLVGRMEAYLSACKEIRQFQTGIYNARQARIDIFFTKESERSGFPYTLKSRIITKALELGGGSWGVWGLQDQGFNNDVRENAGNFRIEMYGYNYDELYGWAEQLKETLLAYRRIKEVLINSEFSWWKDDYQEFYFHLDKARMAQENIRPADLFATLHPVFGKDLPAGSIVVDNEMEKLKLTSRQSGEYDIWNMQHVVLPVNRIPAKLSGLATVGKGQMPQQVAKRNQQYRLCLQYEYIGASNQGQKIQEQILEVFNARLPMGYSARSDSSYWMWGQKDNRQYALLFLIIVIIFFTTSILFNSLKQPLAVIFVIPVSYIGVFLTFYWFGLNFDQGGFASFVLLCGITVNASIYVLNEYNRLREQKPLMPPVRAYLKAWNAKITPIFLTVISTILGFVPFMLGEDREAFWFPLAAGTIGGLVMSVAGIFLYLPVFVLKRERRPKRVRRGSRKG